MKTIGIAANCPATEYSPRFLKGMLDRMATSFHKYGPVMRCNTKLVPPLDNLRLRLKKYEETGNQDYLMDAANFAMIEFMNPSHPEAHYRALGSSESPGLKVAGCVDPLQVDNQGNDLESN